MSEARMQKYGINMITNTIQDPSNLKQNNEIAKAQLKKRLDTFEPGPGSYDPIKPTGKPMLSSTLEQD